MNLEQIPLASFVRWTLFAVAAIVVMVQLGVDAVGLIPVELAFVLLVIFRPPKTYVSDAELYAWLDRG